jgi:sodium-coupled neutral amino acid transporter 11
VILNVPQNDTLINIARFCFGLNMFTTLPLELFVCREVRRFSFRNKIEHTGITMLVHPAQVIEQYFFSHETFNMQRHVFFTTVILFASMIGAHPSTPTQFSLPIRS